MEEEKKKRPSTATVKKGGMKGRVTQKMMSFKVDLDNWEYLESKANKGRYINDIIAEDRKRNDNT